MSPAPSIAGVDGCPAGWYAVQLRPDHGEIVAAVHARFEQLLQACPPSACVAVDIPIGLGASGERACDLAARERLGVKRQEVVS